jgi:L-methionine (R)-S-oxide reductase
MAEELIVDTKLSREEKYKALLPQIKALIEPEEDLIANLSNIASALKYGMDFFWVGFYLVKGNELVLGPFQGTLACTRIAKGKGVCGASWEQAKTTIVDDVEEFPGHIACSSLSKSEIVVPVFDSQNQVRIVIDVDSDKLSSFNKTDQIYLEELAQLISSKL